MQYQAIYKCRMCGEYDFGCKAGEIIVIRCMHQVTKGFDSRELLCPSITEMHYCEDGSYGLADFQGFKKVDD